MHPQGGHATHDNGHLVFYDGGPEPRLRLEWSGGCLKSSETGRFIHPQGGHANRDDVALVFHNGGPEARLELEEIPAVGSRTTSKVDAREYETHIYAVRRLV